MSELEVVGQVAGGIVAGAMGTYLFLGKMINQQVDKSFSKAIEGDGNGNAGLRADLKELKINFQELVTLLATMNTAQAVMIESMKGRDKFCLEKHLEVDRRIENLEARRKTDYATRE